MANSLMMPLPDQVVSGNLTDEEREFWRQPDCEGYNRCLDFSLVYRRKSAKISKEKRKFLVVDVSGGLNQQWNQIVDAVVIARTLEASLVVPVLQVNLIWGDERNFGIALQGECRLKVRVLALHLGLEKDVWVRTGCLTGLGSEYDEIIARIREFQPEYLTGKLNMNHVQRKLAGLCPLNTAEMAKFLKALGVPSSARVYIAGGHPFGGPLASKEMLARDGELSPYRNRSTALASIDYIVSLSNNAFLPSHGGNMGRAMQGHRAYVGNQKYIKPNKQAMIPFFEDSSISDEDLKAS